MSAMSPPAAQQDPGTVAVEEMDGWLRVTLNRPERLNSMDGGMRGRLSDALGRAAADPGVRALLITGAGRAFCAGQDLGEREVAPGGEPPDLGESLRTGYNPLVRAIVTMPKPVVCGVNGVAAGAGANLALCCDLVVAARSARFVQAFCGVGLAPDSGGTWVLPRLVGRARAGAALMLGEPVDAQTALDWGMVFRVVDDGDLAGECARLAERLAKGPTEALGRTKRLLLEGACATLDEQLEREAAQQREAGRSEDYAEGVRAFREKRPPAFRGR